MGFAESPLQRKVLGYFGWRRKPSGQDSGRETVATTSNNPRAPRTLGQTVYDEIPVVTGRLEARKKGSGSEIRESNLTSCRESPDVGDLSSRVPRDNRTGGEVSLKPHPMDRSSVHTMDSTAQELHEVFSAKPEVQRLDQPNPISKHFPLAVSYVDRVNLADHPKLESVYYNSSDMPDGISSPPNTEDDRTDSNDGLLGSGSSNHYTSSPNSTPPPPPTFEEIDNWNHHIDMKAFGEGLQRAANAVFPNEKPFRYTRVSVLLLSWEDEDPQLPVSQEIEKLETVFRLKYYFETAHFKIPDEDSHYRLTERVMAFVKPEKDSSTHLKILYYAGHGRLMQDRSLALTSWRNRSTSNPPVVPWTAVQSLLAESRNDALILLDCCASGTANSSEGHGVTELISACAWNETANGVGPYSLTASLIIELEFLSKKSQFSIGELYKNIYTRTQLRMPETMDENGKAVERHPAPIHLVLTQVHPIPRSIHISKLRCSGSDQSVSLRSAPSMCDRGQKVSVEKLQRYTKGLEPPVDGHGPSNEAQSFQFSSSVLSNQDCIKAVWSSHQWEGSPRLAFSVRLRETIKPEEHMTWLFTEWLKDFPAVAEEVSVEVGFGSFSTLLIVSLPMAVSAYLPQDPAIRCLGPITSSNKMPMTTNVTGLDIFTLLRSKTSEGIALRESLGKYLQLGDEGSSSSSRYQEDLLNAVISNYRKTSKSQSTTSASIPDHFVFLNANIHKNSKTTWSPLETNWSAKGSSEGWSSVNDFTSFS